MSSTTQHPHGPRLPTSTTPHPPSSIADLAAKAMEGLWDDTKELKHYLRMAEKYRRQGKEYMENGDLENAFIYYAKAATLVLDKIPTHRDYEVKLKPEHKSNLGLNGQDILDQLAAIKPVLVDRFYNYTNGEHPANRQSNPPPQLTESPSPLPITPDLTRGTAPASASVNRSRSSRDQQRLREDRNQQQLVNDGVAQWNADRERAEEQERERERKGRRSGRSASRGLGSGYTMVASGEEETRRLEAAMRRREEEYRAAQELGRREEERVERERRRKEEKARRKRAEEEEGILKRQREAEDAARLARSASIRTQPSPMQPSPQPAPVSAPPQQSSSLSSIASSSMASISTNGSSPSSLFAPTHSASSSLTTTPSSSMYGSFYTSTPSAVPPPVTNGAGSSYRPPSNNSSPYPPPASAPLTGASGGVPQPPPPSGISYPTYPSTTPTGATAITPTPTGTSNLYAYPLSQHTDNTTPTTTNTVHPLPPLPMPPPPQSAPVYGSQQQQQAYPYYRPQSQTQPNPTPEKASIYAPPQPIQPQQPPTQPQPRPMHAPQARSRPPSFLGADGISFLPMESPTKNEGDSTDSESLVNGIPGSQWRYRKHHHDHLKTPTRSGSTSSAPPPITTTSPPPGDGRPIEYPRLMSPHQLTQGYTPSLNSMFSPLDSAMSMMSLRSDTLLFDPRSSGGPITLYPREALPPQSAPAGYGVYGMQQQQQPPPPPQHHHHQRPSPNRPPLPNPPTQHAQYHYQPNAQQDTVPNLKTVSLPRDCLPRFLSIAKVNTSLNKETCGLLLGKAKGNRYVVTTLLVPRQHSTSDTCTMDEEELVMQFTEERNLITLGWIHTHPSQSCFMSSVDLHTHSGFQRMLPESFAVVCAPKYNPNFGIFRLTDPPGLKTVLDCKAREAFHPHPDLPIYTDADKGHVQMRDLPLEIVDIR